MESLCDECKPSIRKLFALDSAEENIKNNINLLNEYQTKKNEIDNSLDKLSNFLEQILQAKLEIKDYNNKIKLLKQEQKHIKTNIESYIKRINKVETEENPFLKLLTDNQEAKIETEKTLNKATKMQQYFGVLKFIFSDDGVKRFIIGDIIEALNNHIRNYLIKMGADFIVYFDNNLYYEFVTQTGPCEYFSFSAGERRKLDLAILFAFRDILSINSVQTNILVVDEVLDSSIDTVSLNAVVQILKNKAKLDGQSIFVISHREALRENQELFNHVIRVEREKGLTTIEQEN
jgi:DNA repair exonuclease SbcCD ATPase subunit